MLITRLNTTAAGVATDFQLRAGHHRKCISMPKNSTWHSLKIIQRNRVLNRNLLKQAHAADPLRIQWDISIAIVVDSKRCSHRRPRQLVFSMLTGNIMWRVLELKLKRSNGAKRRPPAAIWICPKRNAVRKTAGEPYNISATAGGETALGSFWERLTSTKTVGTSFSG